MEKLKRLREERGLSQTKLAARADLNPATVNQIEMGRREASAATLRKLAKALDVSAASLLEDEAPKAPTPQPSPQDAEEAGVIPVRGRVVMEGQATVEVRISQVLRAVANHEISPEEGARKVLELVA